MNGRRRKGKKIIDAIGLHRMFARYSRRKGRPEGRSHTKDWIGGGGFEVCGVTLVLCTYYFPYFLSTPFFFFFFFFLLFYRIQAISSPSSSPSSSFSSSSSSSNFITTTSSSQLHHHNFIITTSSSSHQISNFSHSIVYFFAFPRPVL